MKWQSRGLVVVGTVILAAAGLHVTGFGEAVVWASRSSDALARAEKAGLALKASDLGLPRPEASQNAGPLLRALCRPLHRKNLPLVLKPGTAIPTEADLDPYRSLLEASDGLLLRPQLNYHRDWDLGPSLMMPELAQTRSLATLIAARGGLEISQDRPLKALHSAKLLRHLAKLMRDEPTFISLLVANRIELRALDLMGDVAAARPHDKALQKEVAALIPTDDPAPLLAAYRMEAYAALVLARNAPLFPTEGKGGFKEPTSMGLVVREGLPSDLMGKARSSAALHHWSAVMEAGQKGGIRAASDAVNAMNRRVEKSASPTIQPLKDMAFAPFDEQRIGGEVLSGRSALKAFLKALARQEATGRPPRSLAELKGVEVVDEFGRPYLYSLKGGGFEISSLGENGVLNPPASQNADLHLAFAPKKSP